LAFGFFWAFTQFGRDAHLPKTQQENFVAAVALAIFFAFSGVSIGFFEREYRLHLLDIVKRGVLSWLMSLAISLTVLHFLFFISLGRYALVYGSLGALFAVLGFHLVMAWLLRDHPLRFVIVGELTATSQELLAAAAERRNHLEHVHLLREKIFEDATVSLDEAMQLLEEDIVSDLVISSQSASSERVTAIATLALQKGLRVIDEGRFYGEIFRRYPLENLSSAWVVNAGFDVHRPITNTIKRLLDISFALFWIVVLSPLLLLIALAIGLSSKGPVFYVQVRQGRYSRPFRMIKFRSMSARHEGSPATSKGDARITGIGKLLRPLHLDELPQLWNILWGDMSFVGPRPEALEVLEKTRSRLAVFEIRHMLRPGLTGWAQINQGKTLDDLDEVRRKLSYDLYYLKNYGVVFDVLIVMKTVFALTKKTW
jgi:exopolysaccharide biosynthesis polyprenyl glycosylphosphotransferase